MRGFSRRILFWLYAQDESAGRTSSYSDDAVQKALGMSVDEFNLGLKELLRSRFVSNAVGAFGASSFSSMSLKPEGAEWVEMEKRRQRLAQNLFRTKKEKAEQTRTIRIREVVRNMASRGLLRSGMRWWAERDAEIAFIWDIVSARLEADEESGHSTAEDDLESEVESLVENAVVEANRALYESSKLGVRIEIDLETTKQEVLRRVSIYIDQRELGGGAASRNAGTTLIGNQTNITAGNHAMIATNAQSIVQTTGNDLHYGQLRELLMGATQAIQEAELAPEVAAETIELVEEMRQEVDAPTPRRKFLSWCADRFPTAVRSLADIAKIVEAVVKLSAS